MPRYQYRDLEPTREAKEVFARWINYLDEEFTKHKKPVLTSGAGARQPAPVAVGASAWWQAQFHADQRAALQRAGAFAGPGERDAGAGVLR